jgi:sugar phosphate isomerase/epimerase
MPMILRSSIKRSGMTKRRDFIKGVTLTTIAAAFTGPDLFAKKRAKIKIGLVTYQWAKDWDLATIIGNCEATNVMGVELRTEHKHGVEPSLNTDQRAEVRKRFADSGVVLIGYGSNVQFDSPDPAILKKNIDQAKELLKLSKDIGGSGVKVKPNAFHKGIPHEKTIAQIGRSLNEVGAFARELGQQVRLEVHGEETQELPNIKSIMDVAENRNVGVCWNCNPQDLNGKGLEYNFNLVKNRLGATLHMHEMDQGNYPYAELMDLLVQADYSGWMLLECSSDPENKVEAMITQRQLWENMVSKAAGIK